LANKILKKLSLVTMEDKDVESLFDKLKLLNLSHIKAGFGQTYHNAFNSKLNDYKFLSWAWEHGHDVPIIRHTVAEFCKNPQHETVVRSAWLAKPEDLKKELDKE
jgi:hypothetical protein